MIPYHDDQLTTAGGYVISSTTSTDSYTRIGRSYIYIASTGGDASTTVKINPINLVEWEALKRWAVGFHSIINQKILRHFQIRQPVRSVANKRKLSIHKLKKKLQA